MRQREIRTAPSGRRPARLSGAVALACVLVLAASLASCGDDSPATLEEYASWCAESSLLAVTGLSSGLDLPLGFDDEETEETLKELVADYESIVPPPEIAAFHDEVLASLRAAAADVDELRDIAGELDAAASRLVAAPSVRGPLTAGGCLPLPRPAGAQFGPVGSAIVINWEPVPGADSYTVYHDEFSDRSCRADLAGRATSCDRLADEVLVTRYVHTHPGAGDNNYWVSACNRWHCTTVQGDDPAEPVVESPPPAAPDDPEPPRAPTTSIAGPISLAAFEASAPEGYHPVTIDVAGPIWGAPARFTSDSSTSVVAYMLLGQAAGCSIADAQAARRATAYIRAEPLGDLPDFESETVCRVTSDSWDSGWAGLRITHLRVFDESSPTNVTEYVHDGSGGYVATSPAPAPRRTAVSPAAGSDEECSRRWARRPELRFSQAIEMCGGDVEALRAEHVEACANSDPADAGLEWRTYADFARDNEIEGRARAGEARTAGDEDRAAYFELLADRYAAEAEHTGILAAEATAAERDRRERIIAERGVASWAEACRQLTDEMWALDLPGLAEAGVDLAAHFGELANVVCGGYRYDIADLCGGIDFLEVSIDAFGTGLDAFGSLLDMFGSLLEGFGSLLEGFFSIFD